MYTDGKNQVHMSYKQFSHARLFIDVTGLCPNTVGENVVYTTKTEEENVSAHSNNERMSHCLFYTVVLNLGEKKRVQVMSLVCAKKMKKWSESLDCFIFLKVSLSLCFQLGNGIPGPFSVMLQYSPPVAESNNQRQDGQQGAQPVPENSRLQQGASLLVSQQEAWLKKQEERGLSLQASSTPASGHRLRADGTWQDRGSRRYFSTSRTKTDLSNAYGKQGVYL